MILIPLGGTGQRFKKNGYSTPKALINVMGKPILFWLLDNLKTNQLIYIPYNKEYVEYRLEARLRKNYPKYNFKFKVLKSNTRGAAETIHLALDELEQKDEPIICLDSDNFYTIDVLNKWDITKNQVFTFEDRQKEPIYSYLELNETNQIKNIKEKEKISNYACTGAYAFSSFKFLNKYCKKIITSNIQQKGEFYTSTVIQEMIKDEHQFEAKIISKDNWICLGTPIQIRLFCNNYPKICCKTEQNKVNPQRICFDLDNTLVTYPKKQGDYTTVKPIQKNIDYLKYLKTFGHTIIIYTARRMKTHNGNVGKLIADIGKITFETLDDFDIPYDEIYFGKPYADYYIDDLAINCYEDLEKKLGFYQNQIKPRDFNMVSSTGINKYKKESDNLDGEIYYYLNIPNKLKDMFPILIDYDKNNKWYEMEKINGLTVNSLYLSELLTKKNLKHIISSMRRIQKQQIRKVNQDIDIYANYSKKLIKRYNSFVYSKYSDSNEIFQQLNKDLLEYEKEQKGKITVIHGDPVMTNILINNFGKIKFIDMRGKQGNQLTILGDWLYDWAKLYQSLIGYDKILNEKELNPKYEEEMINYFKKQFLQYNTEEDYKNLKLITKSLLFTLIPLHNNKKCQKYYDLIKSKYLV